MALRRVYEFALLATAFLIPSGFYSLTLVPFSIAAACFLASGNIRNLRSMRRAQVLFPVLFYLYIIAGAPFSNNSREAISSLSVYLPYLFYPIFIGCSSVINGELIKKVEDFFLASICLFLGIALLYAVYDSYASGSNLMINEGIYSKYKSFGLTRIFYDWHPTYLALFANHGIAIAVERALSPKQNQKRSWVLYAIIIFFLSVLIFLLDSMAGIIAYIFLMFFFVIRYLGILRLSLLKQGIFFASSFIIVIAFLIYNPFNIDKIVEIKSSGMKVTDQYTERNVLTIRLAKWDVHWKLIKKNFVFGITSGDIKDVRKKEYERNGYPDLALHNYNAHNQYIEIFARYGVLGFLIFMIMLVVPFVKGGHINLFPFMIIVLITLLSESLLERQQGMNYFLFFYALYTSRQFMGNLKPVFSTQKRT